MYQNNNSGGRSQSGYGGGNRNGGGYNGGNRSGGGYGGGNRNGGDNYKGSNANEIPDDQPTTAYVPLTEDNYVKVAEDSIEALKKHTKKGKPKVLTTSKIRNILALNAEIYNDVMNEKDEALSDEFKGRINYLKVRIIYEAGRESTVMCFVTESHLLEHLNKIQGKKSQYLLFSRFLEALVAFRKFKFMDIKDE